MKLKIKRNLNHATKLKIENKNQPHASHTNHVTMKKNTSHATIQKYKPYNHANHAEMPKGDLGCVEVC